MPALILPIGVRFVALAIASFERRCSAAAAAAVQTPLSNFKLFVRDLYSIQTGPKQVEFGHVFEDPNAWEQRYEKKDHENERFQGQV